MKLTKHKAAKIWVFSFSPRTHSVNVLSVRNLHLLPFHPLKYIYICLFQTVQVCFPTTSSCWVKNQSASLSPHAILVTYLQGFSLSSWHQTRVEARISLGTGSRFIRGTNRQARILTPSNFQFPRETLLWVLSKSILWSDARNCWTGGRIECRDAPSTGWVVTGWMLSSDRLLRALPSFSFRPFLTFGLENQVHQSPGASPRIWFKNVASSG